MRRTVTITTTVLLLFGAAACGDDDSGDDDTTETTEAAEDTTTTTEASTDTTSDESVSDRVHAFLDAEYPEYADMIEGFGSVDLSADEAQISLTIGDEPADVDTGVAICEAVLGFAEDEGFSSFEVEVQNDENGDDAELATGNLDDGCEAAWP
jgi:hypothetical protein